MAIAETPGSIKRIARQIIPLIIGGDEGIRVLKEAEEYLEPEDRKQIARKTLIKEFINNSSFFHCVR